MEIIDRVFSFNGSILGFEKLDKFNLTSIPSTAFYQLSSIEDTNIKFILVHPFDWNPDYELHLDQHVLQTIELQDPQSAIVMNIVTVKEPFSSSTVNYMAPLIMNIESGLAIQYVIQDARQYPSHSPLIEDKTVEGGDSDARID